ncbi:MAG: putative methyltransferase [Rhodoglobus sp.]|nr:putative methyltransferase [Rhodoglobus sp.]
MSSFEAMANSFGRAVDAYDSARPDYPAAAFDWLVPPDARTVLDLGAGAGKFTRMLVEARYQTIAVEPSEEMLARLRSGLPTVDARLGSAESIPLEDDAVDAVVVAQAWHWVDAARALPEVARVLRPGGSLGLVWNVLDGSVPWIVALGSAVGGRSGGGFEKITAMDKPFGVVETTLIPWVYELDRDGVVRLVASWSQYITAAPTEQVRLLAAVDEVLAGHPDVAGLAIYPVAYKTHCFRTRLT